MNKQSFGAEFKLQKLNKYFIENNTIKSEIKIYDFYFDDSIEN